MANAMLRRSRRNLDDDEVLLPGENADRALDRLLAEGRQRSSSVPVASGRRPHALEGADLARAVEVLRSRNALEDGDVGHGREGMTLTQSAQLTEEGVGSLLKSSEEGERTHERGGRGALGVRHGLDEGEAADLGRNVVTHRLLDGLRQGMETSGRAASDLMVRGGLLDDGLIPSGNLGPLLETPTRSTSTELRGTPEEPRGSANPFWSPAVRRLSASGESAPREGMVRSRVDEIEAVEALRARILMEADEASRREMAGGGLGSGSQTSGNSYATAVSGATFQHPHPGGLGHPAPPPPPPPPPPVNVIVTDPPPPPPPTSPMVVGMSESLRHLELPTLQGPGGDGGALAFGDWLAVVTPIMLDVSGSAAAMVGGCCEDSRGHLSDLASCGTFGPGEIEAGRAEQPSVCERGEEGSINVVSCDSGFAAERLDLD